MRHPKILVPVALWFASTGYCLAEQPSVRIDLTAPRLIANLVAIPFVFEDSGLDCPEDRSTIVVSKGALTSRHLTLPPFEQPIFPAKYKYDPSDDTTYRLQVIKATCRIDVDIRQQVRDGNAWKSLLVMEERRPSLSEEARQEAVQRRVGELFKPKDAKQVSLAELNKMLRDRGSRRWGASVLSVGLPFEKAPASCMDVIGEYQITKISFAMVLFAPLPGHLNEVVMEGSDLDASHGRIYLTRNDCRFEFTISQSVLRDRQWMALPLRAIPEDKADRPAESNR